MFFGANQNHYADVKPSISGMTMVRSYNGLSSTWPVMPDGLLACLDISPNPAELLAGQLDAELTTFLESAPAGSLLSAWHECDKNIYNHNAFQAPVAQQIHAYMLSITHRVNPAVKYGSVLTQGAAKYSLSPWTIPGLDFYGVDVYDLFDTQDASTSLAHAFNQMPAGPRLVAETNSEIPAHRPSWFRETYDWLLANDGLALLTFWNPTGEESGPFDPSDAATIYALQQIANDARAGSN